MDKARNKRIRRIIAIAAVAAVVVLLACMPLLARQEQEEDGPQASILSGKVETGSISRSLLGGGTLTGEDTVAVTVPSAVLLTEYLVSNGDLVSAGDPIAAVDRVTVMTAITQAQETLEYLSDEIESARDYTENGTVTALAGGTVKLLYAVEGSSVQDVMLQYGALAVLSLDGLMAVDMTAEFGPVVGTTVTVTLEDGTAVTGKVEANLAGEMTITLEDDGYSPGQTVQVAGEDGTAIGSGELYIYSPWNATAYTGTVDSLKVSQGDAVTVGQTLMKITDMGESAAYRQLLSQRQAYEELMLELFKMYQTEQLAAPCDGVVSGLEKNSAQLLSAEGYSSAVSLLANAPNGNDEETYVNYVGQVTAVAQNGWVLSVNPKAVTVENYLDLSGVDMNTELMTETVLHTKTEIPVYTQKEGVWTQIESSTLSVGDVLVYAFDGQGNLVWSVLIQKANQEPAQPESPNTSENEGSGGSKGSISQGGMAEQEQTFELYGLETAQIAVVTPQSTMTLEISVDEQDVKDLETGMSAEVKVDALGGEKFTAQITDISNSGTNNGGSSKFTVVLTMDRGENMLAGMHAAATVILDTTDEILTVPAAALVEQGAKTVIYTGYDEKNEQLTDPVEVTVGMSDGEKVQLLKGLEAGAVYYYSYYDTLEASVEPDFGSSFAFGR